MFESSESDNDGILAQISDDSDMGGSFACVDNENRGIMTKMWLHFTKSNHNV